MWISSFYEWSSLRGLKIICAGGSTMKFKGANHDEPPQWLDSDLIPRLLENFENWKNFMAILLSVKNDAYRRIFGA